MDPVGPVAPLRVLEDVVMLDAAERRLAEGAIGQLSRLERRTLRGLATWANETRVSLRRLLRRAGRSRAAVFVALEGWPGPAAAEAFEKALQEPLLQADLGGRLMVAGVELGRDRIIDLSVPRRPRRQAGELVQLETAEEQAETYFGMPFEEAIAFFREKRLVDESLFDAIEDRYKQSAFVARRLAESRMLEIARRVIAVGIEEARTLDELLIDLERALGIVPDDNAGRWYLETVARTNLASAYGAGRWDQMNDPTVVALRPFVQYRTARDERVRLAHAALNGRVFRLGTALASQYAPPLGFNCRCQYATLSERQVVRRGLRVEQSHVPDPRTGLPYLGDAGWTGPPGRLGGRELPGTG